MGKIRDALARSVGLALIMGSACLSSAQIGPDLQWIQLYGDTDAGIAECFCITEDGGFLIAGNTGHSFPWDYDLYVVRADSAGEILWTRHMISPTRHEFPIDLAALPDDRFAIAVSVATHGYSLLFNTVLILDGFGDSLYESEHFLDFAPTELLWTDDGGLVMLGADFGQWDASMHDYGLCILDSSLALVRRVSYGGWWEDEPWGFTRTDDGGFLIMGSTLSFAQNGAAWWLRLSAQGDSLDSRIDSAYGAGGVRRFFNLPGPEFLAFGGAACDTGSYWMCRVTEFGDTIWTRCLGTGVVPSDAVMLSSNLIVGVGYHSDIVENGLLVVGADSMGNLLWSSYLTEASGYGDRIVATPDGGFAVLSTIVSEVTGYDFYLMKFGWDSTDSPERQDRELPEYVLHPLYPNPFNASTTIRFEIPLAGMVKLNVYDVTGRLVATPVSEVMNPGAHAIQFDASHLSSGVYFCRMEAGEFLQTVKMVVLK